MRGISTSAAARIRYGILGFRYVFQPQRLTTDQSIFVIERFVNGHKVIPRAKRNQLEFRGYLHSQNQIR